MSNYQYSNSPDHHERYSIKLGNGNFIMSSRQILIAIIVVSVILRLFSAIYQGNYVSDLPGIYDQISYDELARRVADGYGFSFAEGHWPITGAGEPTAHWSFLYTLYLAAVYIIFGPSPLIARLLQAIVVGILHPYITYRIGEKIFGKNIGYMAAAITSVYTYYFYYGAALMTESFYIIGILFSLFLSMQLVESTNKNKDIAIAIALGISIGVTVLLRQVFLLFLPFLYLWVWIARFLRRRNLPIVSTGISIALIVLSILPVSLYNYSRFGRLVLLNTNSGYAFFWGNHPIYGTKFISILPSGTYQRLIPPEVRSLDEAALDQELLQRGLQFVFEDPKRYFLLSLSRIPAYFMFWPSTDSGTLSNISRVASFGVTWPFMLWGVILSMKKIAAGKGRVILNLTSAPEGLLVIFVVIYSAIHLLTWALIRYRLPVDAVLIPFAAVGLADVIRRILVLNPTKEHFRSV